MSAVGVRRWRVFALFLLAPTFILIAGLQLASLCAGLGTVQLALAVVTRTDATLERAVSTLQTGFGVAQRVWDSPAGRLVQTNPVSLGGADDARATARALATGAQALGPASELAELTLGFDGRPRLVAGSVIDLAVLPDIGAPTEALAGDLTATAESLRDVPGGGPLGRPIGALTTQWHRAVVPLARLVEAVHRTTPSLASALGAREPKRYLVCALNDAELFGSGGAPLAAALVEAAQGRISVPVSGQLESKLSPNNPPITWEFAGGQPWYREDTRYPFVNSNFAPDFRAAGVDMRRAWAALGYPRVDGVITVDVTALAEMLDWAGGSVKVTGYGRVSAANIVSKVLVSAYRDFNSPEGVEVRHRMNTDLAVALARQLGSPQHLLDTLTGALAAIPGRHIQASFRNADLQSAAASLGATGELGAATADTVGVFTQSAPNKLSIFQRRRITHDVELDAMGGARVTSTISYTNEVPAQLTGDPNTYLGYTALRARFKAAYRLPDNATNISLDLLGDQHPVVRASNVGPHPNVLGGQYLWQGQEIAPRALSTVVIKYTLPAGTFGRGSSRRPVYSLRADPQALHLPARLEVRVTQAARAPELTPGSGWRRSGKSLVWVGDLDQPLHLALYSAL